MHGRCEIDEEGHSLYIGEESWCKIEKVEILLRT